MTRKEILDEFVSQWDRLPKDKVISPADFEDYYTDISATIDRDDYFELILYNAWKLPGGGVAPEVLPL